MRRSIWPLIPFVALMASAVLTASSTVYAVNASPHTVRAKQPDGTPIALKLRGNEFHHWYEDADGYQVVDQSTDAGKRYVYAAPATRDGRTTASDRVVGKDAPPVGLGRGIVPPRPTTRRAMQLEPRVNAPHDEAHHASQERFRALTKKLKSQSRAPQVTVKNLVIPIRFNNHQTRTLPTRGDLDVIFNKPGGHSAHAVGGVKTGSVKDFYSENSYGTFELDSTVVDWIDVSKSEAYYADGDSGTQKLWEALREALNSLQAKWSTDPSKSFKDFDQNNDGFIDAIAFVHSGYAAEFGGADVDGVDYKDRIWSHRWVIQAPPWQSPDGVTVSDYHINPGLWGVSGSEPGRIGVICHETGHFFGLPDLYDTSQAGEGIGSWGIMANSWGFDGTQLYPPHFSAWSKQELGWLTPTVISGSGEYDVAVAEKPNPNIYKVEFGDPKEYLLIENRQYVAFGKQVPEGTGGRGGLAVWHIDENKPANNDPGWPPNNSGWPTSHYMIALLQADGAYELEQGGNRGDADDVFRKGFVDEINATSIPSTNAYGASAGGVSISHISASSDQMSFRLNQEGPVEPPKPDTADGCCPVAASSEYVYDGDNPQIYDSNSVMLKVDVTLPREMDVHMTANTSLQGATDNTLITTGFYDADTDDSLIWPGSFRFSSLPTANNWVNVSNVYAVRMPAGTHTIYWKIWTSESAETDSATMTVEAFDVSTSSASRAIAPRLNRLKGASPKARSIR